MASLLALALAASATCAAADPVVDRAVQHDVMAWHLAQGDSRELVCAIAEQYFAVRCAVAGDNFVLTRGTGVDITYLATIRIPTTDTP